MIDYSSTSYLIYKRFYCFIIGNFILVYILNEKGNLFTFIKPISEKEEFLIYLYDFCINVIKRLGKSQYSDVKNVETKVKKIQIDRFGKISVLDETSIVKGRYVLSSGYKRGLIASVSRKDKAVLYNIVYPDRESSGFVPFKDLGKISLKILEYKKKGIGINTYIRDLIFSDPKQYENVMGSTLYFLEKYKIESILEKAIKKLQ